MSEQLESNKKGFTAIFIEKPVLACVLSLIVLIIGINAYFSLPLRLYPRIDNSVVTVSVSYPGASPELMESFVALPLENAISEVDGLDYVSSKSSNGAVSIKANFKLGYDINIGASDIQSQVSAARWKLPKNIYDPIVSKVDAEAQSILYLTVNNESNMTFEEVTDYLHRVVEPQIQTLRGASQMLIFGGQDYAMRIFFDPIKMSNYGISGGDIYNAIIGNNMSYPSGTILNQYQEIDVSPKTELSTAKQFNDLIIGNRNNGLIRMSDIGHAELSHNDERGSVYNKRDKSMIIAINAKSNANPLDVSSDVLKLLPNINKNMPKGLHIGILWDSSQFIRASIHEVKRTIAEAVIFVVIVVFAFLGSFRALLIPIVTIPVSIIGVLGLMMMMKYSMNTLTYMALVLAIGMVVDDAIVIAENIHRHITEGRAPKDASIIGAKEIQFAIISITLTLVAVYAPIGFIGGVTGALFKEFAFTLAGAVLISGFVALTLSPMMCSKILRGDTMNSMLSKKIHNLSMSMTNGYRKILEKVIDYRKTIYISLSVILVICAGLFMFIQSDLIPKEDEGAILTVVQGPPSANLSYMEKYTNRLHNIYEKHVPERDSYIVANGAMGGQNSAMSILILKPWTERKRSVDQIVQELLKEMWQITGVQAFPLNPSSAPGTSETSPLEVVIQTTKSYQELNDMVQAVLKDIKSNLHGLVNVKADLKLNKPRLDVTIDREKAGTLGVSIQDIDTSLNVSLGTPLTGYFTKDGRNYAIYPAVYKEYRESQDVIDMLKVHTSSGAMIPLSSITTINETVQPERLDHFQQMRASDISAIIIPPYSLGKALDDVQKIIKKHCGNDIKIDFKGESRQFVQSRGAMVGTFVFALIFIYLILAAQFESFLDPVIVMFTVPLSTFGALVALLCMMSTLNIFSNIGLVTLIGLISKHGILIVEFANQLRREGRNIREAVIEAASIRLRPVLMTTFAMILGALPLALAHGAGAVSRRQIGWVIVTGMSIGTLFTLFVIPTFYIVLKGRRENK